MFEGQPKCCQPECQKFLKTKVLLSAVKFLSEMSAAIGTNVFELPVVRLKALVYRKAFNKANCFLDICKMKITFAKRP